MIRAHLLSAYEPNPQAPGPQYLARHSARSDGISLTEDPAEADIVIFCEGHTWPDPYYLAVRKHPVFRKWKQKCVLYCDGDRSITAMPTLTPSMEAWQFNPRTKKTFHYFSREWENHAIDQCRSFETERQYLFSFVGDSTTHPVRRKILDLPDDNALLRDTHGRRGWLLPESERWAYEQFFVDAILKSHFVLCPRGVGPASYRLFETMQLGRVPVVLSDAWVPIDDVNWAECALFVPERRVRDLPSIMAEHLPQAELMGFIARRTWEQYFAPEVTLRRLVDAALQLKGNGYHLGDLMRDYAQFHNGWHLVTLLRHLRRSWQRNRRRARSTLADDSQ